MSDFSTRRVTMVDTQVRPSDVTKFPIIAAMLHVPQDTKTGTRPVPLNATATATLGDLDRFRRDVARRTERLPEYVFVREDGRDFTSEVDRNRLSCAVVNAMRGAGLTDASFHTLRHYAEFRIMPRGWWKPLESRPIAA